jgi:hypothetical protein
MQTNFTTYLLRKINSFEPIKVCEIKAGLNFWKSVYFLS